jgi:hypothetical protein
LKIDQIDYWHQERIGDATTTKDNQPLMREAVRFLTRSDAGKSRTELLKWMQSVVDGFDYKNVLLTDTLMKVKLTLLASDSVPEMYLKNGLNEIKKNHKPLLSDLHKSNIVNYAHADLVIPLVDPDSKNSDIKGYAVFRIDPEKRLFPLIQSWPTSSKSAETLILRKENDSILYLNELRHRKNTALNLRLPLTNNKLLAAQAAKGQTGIMEGIDYRNVPVIGYSSKIPGTNWIMVAKVDKDELMVLIKRYLILVIFITVLLIFVNAAIVGFWIWDHRVKLYKSQVKNELDRKALEKNFEYIFKYANDILTLLDKDLKVVMANDKALSSYGYTRDEMIGW